VLSKNFPFRFTGRLHDDLSLRAPTAPPMHSCSPPARAICPVTGGLPAIVADRVTGALAEPFEPASFAAAICWVLEDPQRRRALGAAARELAERLWAPVRVAGLVAEVYARAMA
jgi:glycosyltransferase involved in cell wall biosynthesis